MTSRSQCAQKTQAARRSGIPTCGRRTEGASRRGRKKGPMSQADLESMFRSLKKAVIERAMSAQMNEHHGYRQGESKPEGQANQRNGTSGKTVITDDGPVHIEVPRDRDGNFVGCPRFH